MSATQYVTSAKQQSLQLQKEVTTENAFLGRNTNFVQWALSPDWLKLATKMYFLLIRELERGSESPVTEQTLYSNAMLTIRIQGL